jgi:hypothetical protein
MKAAMSWGAIAASLSATVAVVLLSSGSPASAASPVFTATPHSTTAGAVETIAAVDLCPAPAGAGDWVAIVNVAQGGNSQITFKNFLIAVDGSWGGTLQLPASLVPGPAQLTASCFDAHHDVADEVDYASVDLTITLPATTSSSSSSSSSAPTSATPSSSSTSGGGTLADTGFRYTVPLTAFAVLAMVAGLGMLYAGRTARRSH